MLGNSTVVVVVVVRTRPRAIPLAKITMRKSIHGFLLSFPCMMSMGLRLAALRAAGAPLLWTSDTINQIKVKYLTSNKLSAKYFRICGSIINKIDKI